MENIFRIESNIVGMMVAAVVIWIYYGQIKNQNQENKVFLTIVYMTVIELVLDSIFWIVDGRQLVMGTEINMIINTLYYFFQVVICYVWTLYCDIHMEQRINKVRAVLLSSIMIVGIVFLIANVWNGCVFTVNENNVYRRSWGFGGTVEAVCCLLYPAYTVVFILFKMISQKEKFAKDGRYMLLVSVIPIISAIIQIKVYGLNFIWIGMTMALLLVLVEIEIRQYNQLQNELSDQRIQIMLSQIQPHFLYNSLSSIACLCDDDPKLAKKATVDFAQYLRGNLDSLKMKEPVPFERELKHINVYLSLEQMRFTDRLKVVYDIEATNFKIPALSIQPIIENAVKYGVGKKRDGGTVTISTKEEQDCYKVIVIDNGIGFDPYKKHDDGRTHIGIENVKNRLMDMCGASLEINTVQGEGTVVTVKVPK